MNIAKKIVDDILDKGLEKSTFREMFPDAYNMLLEYRDDLEESVLKFIPKDEWEFKNGFSIHFNDADHDFIILEGTPQDVLDYKKWYSVHNHIKIKTMTHQPTIIVIRTTP